MFNQGTLFNSNELLSIRVPSLQNTYNGGYGINSDIAIFTTEGVTGILLGHFDPKLDAVTLSYGTLNFPVFFIFEM